MRALLIAGLFLITSGPAMAAETRLRVSASIVPVQRLVQSVMHDPAQPDVGADLIVPPGASPHGYALKPSEARSLAAADVVFRIGPTLEGFLDRPLRNLAASAVIVDLIEAPEMVLLPVRDDADFAAHDHGDHDAHRAEHDDDHKNEHDGGHGHDEEHGDDDEHGDDEKHGHDDEHGDDEKHGHGDDRHRHGHEEHAEHADPHVWLHPANAIAMVREIARVLAEADPGKASLYRSNAKRTIADLELAVARFEADWRALLNVPKPVPFVVFHDSLQYFEAWSGVASSGSITLNPEVPPGARHMQELRQRLQRQNVRCVFVEPQLDGRVARQIAEDVGLSVHVVDPLGLSNSRTGSGAGSEAGSDDGSGGFASLIGGIRNTLGLCHLEHLKRSPFKIDGQKAVKD